MKKLKDNVISALKYLGTVTIPIVLAALLKGESLKGLTPLGSLARLMRAGFAVPLWLVLILLVGTVAAISYVLRLRREVLQIRREAANGTVLENMNDSKPQLYISWERQQCVWGTGTIGTKPAMQIIGWAMVSISGTEPIILREAYIKGTEPVLNCMDVVIKPGAVTKEQITTFVQPIIVNNNEDLKASLILRDHKNREYITPEVTFRALGIPAQLRASPPAAETPK